MNATLSNLLIPVITIVGLVVLMGLGKVSADVALPLIAGLAGVHVGANVANPPAPSGSVPTPSATGGVSATLRDRPADMPPAAS